MSSKTYREVNKDLVLQACEQYIKVRRAHIDALQEPLIQKEMKPKMFGFIKAKTREQAKANLGHDRWNDYTLVQFHGGYDANRVMEIRALCMIPGDSTVKLSAEDAGILSTCFG